MGKHGCDRNENHGMTFSVTAIINEVAVVY